MEATGRQRHIERPKNTVETELPLAHSLPQSHAHPLAQTFDAVLLGFYQASPVVAGLTGVAHAASLPLAEQRFMQQRRTGGESLCKLS